MIATCANLRSTEPEPRCIFVQPFRTSALDQLFEEPQFRAALVVDQRCTQSLAPHSDGLRLLRHETGQRLFRRYTAILLADQAPRPRQEPQMMPTFHHEKSEHRSQRGEAEPQPTACCAIQGPRWPYSLHSDAIHQRSWHRRWLRRLRSHSLLYRVSHDC